MSQRLYPLVACIVFSLLLGGCDSPDGDFAYRDTQGNSGHLSDLKGKWVLINYWAVWCKPCIKEIPELNRFAQQHSDSVALFGVNFDEAEGQTLRDSIAKLGIQFPVLTDDPSAALGVARPSVLPTTLVINPQGTLEQTLHGPQTDAGLSKIIGR